MKNILILALSIALSSLITASAQQISVVSSDGTTSLYETLNEAINGAIDGSVIYLPGGGFTIPSDVRINKRLTIIGIGHRYDNDNVDGATIISGYLYFDEGSDGSALMGCYVKNDVYIGIGGRTVNNILIRYCNLYSVRVMNNTCQGVVVDQNYIRFGAGFSGSPSIFTHNISPWVFDLDGGMIKYNIFTSIFDQHWNAIYIWGTMAYCDNDQISNNILITGDNTGEGTNNVITHNMLNGTDWGDDPVTISGDWNDVFVNYNDATITPSSDFHFTEAYNQYSSCGIYGGTGFNDHQTAPVPYIVSKEVAEQTDASGHLNITVVVKAGE